MQLKIQEAATPRRKLGSVFRSGQACHNHGIPDDTAADIWAFLIVFIVALTVIGWLE